MVSRNRKSAGGSSRGGSSRSSRSRSQNIQERDEEGRFVSDEDEGMDGGNYSAGEDDIDDDVYESRGGGYGRGGSSEGRGWNSDYEGHSVAAQRGWEHRGGQGGRQSAGGRNYGGGQQMRNDDYYDDRYEARGGRGGSYNDDIGEGEGRGWFGDYEGHSEAAQLGWEHRGRSGSGQRGGQGRSQSRNRGGQSQYQSRGGQQGGHGGWFGDPRGHAEAARRGWQDRR